MSRKSTKGEAPRELPEGDKALASEPCHVSIAARYWKDCCEATSAIADYHVTAVVETELVEGLDKIIFCFVAFRIINV